VTSGGAHEGAVDVAVVGAGVVGLAIARALALEGREVVVLEQHASIASETSSRNSEVIHAGIYYPPGSLKARLCVAGRDALYEHCARRSVPHARVGKIIVATAAAEEPVLERLMATARANGVDDLVRLSGAELARREPEVRAAAAIFSPSTGIVDAHELARSLLVDARAAGATLALRARVSRVEPESAGFTIAVETGDTLRARSLINAAGLHAESLALAVRGLPRGSVPRVHLCKGSYFALQGASPFRHLVYPVPGPSSLGVHATLDLAGRARFGPDAEYVERIDYDVAESRGASFYEAIRRYWPALPDGALTPAYSGIRPKLQAEGSPPRDWEIQGPEDHGVPGLVQLFGIESPGLTACLAIADEVRRRL